MQTAKFSVLSHRMEGLTMLCHCPNCGNIYHFGKYRIEDGENILCYRQTMECLNCGIKGLPFPVLFDKTEELAAFYKKTEAGPIEMAFASKDSMEIAFGDPKFFGLVRQ
jgi:hypothetical protein